MVRPEECNDNSLWVDPYEKPLFFQSTGEITIALYGFQFYLKTIQTIDRSK